MPTDGTNIVGMEAAVNTSPISPLQGCLAPARLEPSRSRSRTFNESNATPLSSSAENKQYEQQQLCDQTLGSPLTHTIADTTPHSPLAPPKDVLEASGVPASKRVTRKHNVSFGSPLAQQITTPNKLSLSPSDTARPHHRPRISMSPSGSLPFSTSAQQLALIQQRYVAEQDIARQQRRLRGQLSLPLPPTSPNGLPMMLKNTANETLVEGARGVPATETHHNTGEGTGTKKDPHSQLQEQPPYMPVVPTVSDHSNLHAVDVKHTNQALAQQLAMLTLINQFKAVGSHPNPGNTNLTQSRTMSRSHVENAGNPPEMMSRVVSGMVTDHISSGTVLGTRTDPLYNPGNTSNVYINNLPTAFTEAHLYQLCAAFGTILSVRMMLRETGTCYGFVLFETVEAAESCIMWLRQFSDVHPSFARTPLKTVAHKLLDHQQPANLRTITFPEDISGSPIHFTRVHTEDDLCGTSRTPSSDKAQPHDRLPTNGRSSLLLSQSKTPASSDLKKSHANRDVRPSNGRLGPIGLQQLFPQRDPASIDAIVNAAVGVPPTPPRGAVVPTTVEIGNSHSSTSSLTPSLLVDGLPSTVDLPSLEFLFSPHCVLSARFFRTNHTPDSTITDPIRVIALVRLESVIAAKEFIHNFNGQIIPGWTPPGTKMTVSFADSDTQSRLTLSERVQTILPQHADSLDSPLRRKSRTLYHKTQTAPSSFVSTISDSIFSKPLTRNPSYELLPPVAKLLGIDDPHIRSVLRSKSANIASDGASFTDDSDEDAKIRAVSGSPSSPEKPYKVPDNTPAKSASAQTGRATPRYVVQLPANYLQRRANFVTHDSDEDEDNASGPSRTIIDGPFPMPAPSLFKAPRKSAPVRIRAPSEGSARGAAENPHVSGTEFHTPELNQCTKNGDTDNDSPTATFGTATPATSASPFTPLIASARCSPTAADPTLIDHNQHPVQYNIEIIPSDPL